MVALARIDALSFQDGTFDSKSRTPEDARLVRDEVSKADSDFDNEYDEIDDIATHIVIYEDDEPIATCRFFDAGDLFGYEIDRIAVRKAYMGSTSAPSS